MQGTTVLLTVSPVRPAPSHVQTLHSCSLPNIILVVHIRKGRIMLCRTIIIEATTPRSEIASFELGEEAGLGIRVVRKPLKVIPNDRESSIRVRASCFRSQS